MLLEPMNHSIRGAGKLLLAVQVIRVVLPAKTVWLLRIKGWSDGPDYNETMRGQNTLKLINLIVFLLYLFVQKLKNLNMIYELFHILLFIVKREIRKFPLECDVHERFDISKFPFKISW